MSGYFIEKPTKFLQNLQLYQNIRPEPIQPPTPRIDSITIPTFTKSRRGTDAG